MRGLAVLLVVTSSLLSASALAEGVFIDLYPTSHADIKLILDTLDDSISAGHADAPPILMMLHGPQAGRFVRPGYSNNKSLVDQVAKLVGYGVIEVKICATWLEEAGYTEQDLFPFTTTVPFGPAELERLAQEAGYTEFSIDL